MEPKEKIKVYINIKKGNTICLCSYYKKMCHRDCEVDMVERDRFDGWEKTFARDRYGKLRNDWSSHK